MAPHRHAKRAWPRHKIIPVKWFNLVGKCSSINSANSQTVDFVVKVATGILTISADYKVEIVDGISAISADQKWNVVGACSNSPSVTIEIVEGISAISADLKVEIVTGISAINADKIICISGADQLEVDLLKKLKLIE